MHDLAEQLSAVTQVETGARCGQYALDGLVPEVVVEPGTAEEVQDALSVCHRLSAPGVVWGGGNTVQTGMPPAGYRWALSTARLTQVVDYSPADLVVTAEAGMSLASLQSLLLEHHQWLPIDAPLPESQTLGGIVASGGAGPRRQRYGLPRDWLLAVQVALPEGELVKGGVGVVKNVAGYDVPRLFAGSWGTLGVLVAVTFKVVSVPETSILYRGLLDSADRLSDLHDAFSHPHLQPELLEVVYSPVNGWQLYCGLAGVEEDVRWQYDLLCERAQLDWHDATAEFDTAVSHRYLTSPAQCRCRCVVPPAHTPAMLIWIYQQFPDAEVQAHFGLGVVRIWWAHGVPYADSLQRLREESHRLGGFCVLEYAPAEVKWVVGVWDRVGGAPQVMRRLKEAFDPHRILAPGRFVEGI